MTLEELYEMFEKKMHGYAIELTGDYHQSEDLVQETFMRAMSHLELLKVLNEHQREAWLRRTLKHRFLDILRRRKRQKLLDEHLTWHTQIISDVFSEVILEDIFDQLPEQYHDLLHRRYVLGMNSQEIACEFEIPAATVRSRLHQAMKWIRANKSRLL